MARWTSPSRWARSASQRATASTTPSSSSTAICNASTDRCHAAVNHSGQPTVILAKTIKGYGMGVAGEAQNITHQQKKMNVDAIRRFRDRFQIPVPDDKLEEVPYVKFEEGSPELEYMRARRMELGGYLPARRRKAEALPIPAIGAFERFLKSTDER